MIRTRVAELGLGGTADPRGRRGRRWQLNTMLSTVLVGMTAGCQSLRDVERLSANLPLSARRGLRLKRRLPDTTARSLLVGLLPDDRRAVIHRQVRAAHRRKQLRPDGLPCGVVSVDGRSTATPCVDDHCV
jgi:hypothetical protein